MKETGKMKTLRYILLSVAVASLASACSDDLNPDGPANKAEKGDEVRFTMTLPGADTRTIYGEENTVNKSFPIYWVDGDKVQVCSPKCLNGRNNAEYSISAGKNQNYATSMTHTGDAGVQWGESENADFYSVYPSGSAALSMSGTDVTASLGIAASQTAKLNPDLTTSTDSVYQPEDMKNVIMVAKTTNVPLGTDVVLRYIPFSTVIEFEINGPSDGTAGAATEMIVQTLTLTAPTGINIAGKFELALNDMPATSNISDFSESNFYAKEVTGGSNEINLHLIDDHGAYATVSARKKLKVKMCLIPQPYTSIEGWTVKITTPAGNYTKTIKDYTVSEGKSKNLVAGMVHKVQLPPLNYNAGWTYDPANWIPSLPDYRNIYLSEISLPGAWYTGSTESYQTNSDVATLWANGVRAFAVECRSYSTGRYAAPSRICISGSGGASGDAYSDYVGLNSHDAIHISTLIKDICDKLATQTDETKQEYAVLVLSYADGGDGGHRYVDHDYFLNGIANEITQSKVDTKYIFGYNGESLSANTTVADAKGKLIIKVNMDYNTYGTRSGQYQNGTSWFSPTYANYSYIYNNDLNASISYTPFLSTIGSDNYAQPCYSNLYWKSWSDDENKKFGLVSELDGKDTTNSFIWVFSSANRTHEDVTDGSTYDIPTYEDRKQALGAMMTYSKAIYDASTHNVWFYFNCGGTLATSSTSKNPSPTKFATEMNKWLLNEAIAKKTDASPLGIVMFNQCTNDTYNGPAIIKAIIEMNSKFYLKHAGTSGNGTGGTTYSGDSPVTSGGEAI